MDEISTLPMELQPKILRAIQEMRFTPLGSTKEIEVNVRIVSATNENIGKLVENAGFREDLYYRLNVIPLHIPPLRKREEDIIPMARHILNQITQDASIAEIVLDRQAEKAMIKYDWPGNAREVSNVLERILSSLKGDIIHLCDLPFLSLIHI